MKKEIDIKKAKAQRNRDKISIIMPLKRAKIPEETIVKIIIKSIIFNPKVSIGLFLLILFLQPHTYDQDSYL